MIQSTDQLNRVLEFTKTPVRIVSVVPSQTELLYDLGLDSEVVGITKFCIHPTYWQSSKTRVGGTKNLNIDLILSQNPDLVIANREENKESEIRQLMRSVNVWVSDIGDLKDSLSMISGISELVGRSMEGKNILEKIVQQFNLLNKGDKKLLHAVYLIWHEPLMTVGGDTFISDMMMHAGFKNLFDDKKRYPAVSENEILERKPDVILLSSEPYPYFDKKIDEFKVKFPFTKIHLVDGEMFSWYGSGLQKAPAYFREIREKIQSAL